MSRLNVEDRTLAVMDNLTHIDDDLENTAGI